MIIRQQKDHWVIKLSSESNRMTVREKTITTNVQKQKHKSKIIPTAKNEIQTEHNVAKNNHKRIQTTAKKKQSWSKINTRSHSSDDQKKKKNLSLKSQSNISCYMCRNAVYMSFTLTVQHLKSDMMHSDVLTVTLLLCATLLVIKNGVKSR